MDYEISWHDKTEWDALGLLESNINGLTQEESTHRLIQYGRNKLPQPYKRSRIIKFLSHFNNILIYVLIFSAFITLFLQHYIDALVIFAVVVINAIIGYVQEGKAEDAMQAIQSILSPKASVFYDGKRFSIDAELLVPGDIVVLEAGDKVPADLRIIQAHSLHIQEAILTGESLAVEKNPSKVNSDVSIGDHRCMAYSGTLVTTGHCKGLVVATGSYTQIGKISNMLTEIEPLATPLVNQMNYFAKWLTILILTLAVLLLIFGYYFAKIGFSEIFMIVVGLSVAAIPEGLPAILTITLAIGVQRMARENAIVRHLPAIETTGAVSVICSDKTGTLTKNEMMVASVCTKDGIFIIEGNGYEPKGVINKDKNILSEDKLPILHDIARVACLCNDSHLHIHDNQWRIEGDPMEGALLSFAAKTGLNIEHEQSRWARTDQIPFDTETRLMATLDHDHEHHAIVCVKGAPEKILSLCQYEADGVTDKNEINKEYWLDKIKEIASLGQRVLALAYKKVDAKHTVLENKDLNNQLVFLGLVGIMDPPRPEVLKAIQQCRNSGINVKMITGDHAITAKAIGDLIGLENTSVVLTGADLDCLSDDELKQKILDVNIFARTSPGHKLRIVKALQDHNMIVAMTGDGVNDSPALKRADVGIAMGLKGSEAAKEASQLVLTDDDFASIVSAVKEGRTVYDNIKKVISWTLPTNAGEASTIIVALLFGMSLPVTPIQILWINLITAVTLGIALAFEPTEEKTMCRKPRNRNEAILSKHLVWHIILVSILFLCGVYGIFSYAINEGYTIELARTMAMNTLVVMEVFHLFFIRNIYGTSLTLKAVLGTKVIWMTVVIIIVAQFAITYIPVFQIIFQTANISFFDGLLIVFIGMLLFACVEIEKQIRIYLTGINKW